MATRILPALLLLAGAGDGHPEPAPTVWVFFSPDSPDASALFRQLEGHPVRPVLLVEDYFAAKRHSRDFLETVRVSGELLVVDEEGLREAERLGISALPAVAVTHHGRTHVATGNRINVKELLQCSR